MRVLLTSPGGWAGFAGLVPGLAHVIGTAADLVGEVEGQLVLTRCAVEVPVAQALSHVCFFFFKGTWWHNQLTSRRDSVWTL